MSWMWKNMLNFDILETQPWVWTKLRKSLSSNRIVHAYLFLGPTGSGKEQSASFLAATLNCLTPIDGIACRTCKSCVKFFNGNHSNVQTVVPEGATIKLHQIKEVKRQVSLRKVEQGYLVVIFHNAEKMTNEAANSLLNLLEEPPPSTVFILTADNSFALLSTIVSRCQKLIFKSVAPIKLASKIAEENSIDLRLAEYILQLSKGDKDYAVELIEEGILELRQQLLNIVVNIKKLNAAELLFLAEDWGKGNPELVLDLLLSWYRDLEVWNKTGADNLIINMDRFDLINEHDDRKEEITQILDILIDAQQALSRNANKQITMENLLLKWARVYN